MAGTKSLQNGSSLFLGDIAVQSLVKSLVQCGEHLLRCSLLGGGSLNSVVSVSHGSLHSRVSIGHRSLNGRVGVRNRLLDFVFDGLNLLDLDLGLGVDNRGNLVGVGSVASVPRWVVSVSLVENVGISFSLSLGVSLGKVMVSTVDSGVLVGLAVSPGLSVSGVSG